ncbi:MAG: DUF4129 domain-containing protein [Chloroflexi bacterium]|nr:DUF4129 domain-containing protein [Chloroflexota bacterium]
MGEDEGRALAQLHAILAQPQFQVDRSVPWWQQLLGPVFDLVWSLLAQLGQLVLDTVNGRQGSIGVSVLVVSAAVLVLTVSYLVRTVRLSVVREAQLHTASLAERRERSDQLWRSAQQLAAAGQLAEATRLAYLSALYALDERAVLHVETNLTNREHAERLKQRHPALGDSFTELVDGYERVRYGHSPVADETFRKFSARAEQVRQSVLEAGAA